MKTILVIHGPNLNILGKRAKQHYGILTLRQIVAITSGTAKKLGYKTRAFQSNHEGALIDWIQKYGSQAAGIVINPGALTHYSYALHDALQDAGMPAIEVHLSDIHDREDWRAKSVILPACVAQVAGKKEAGYVEAVALLHAYINRQ